MGHSVYYLLLSSAVPVYTMIALGYLCARFRVVKQNSVDALNTFVFKVCVPALAFKLLATTDLKDSTYWSFSLAFLLLRTSVGTACAIYTYFRGMSRADFVVCKCSVAINANNATSESLMLLCSVDVQVIIVLANRADGNRWFLVLCIAHLFRLDLK